MKRTRFLRLSKRRVHLDKLSVDALDVTLIEGERDASGDISDVGRLSLWDYFQLFKSLDPITRRDIVGLQASNFLLKLRIFRLECRDKLSQVRIFILECRHGLRGFPRFHLVTPNVKWTP
jgi:hypothetical protein